MLHLPLLRRGVAYRSVETAKVLHHRTRETVALLSQANPGLIRRDLLKQAEARSELASIPARELLAMAGRAARHFMADDLTIDPVDGVTQSPQQYVEQLSSTTGMPWVLVRRNMEKIRGVMAEMGEVIAGLTRGLDWSVLDEGVGVHEGHAVSFYPRGHSLGVVLPNNSPGVHSLWVPAIGLKTPLVLKPGSSEPWTPYRIAQAFIRAGCPPAAFSLYPTDHAGGAEMIRHTGRGMFFGDAAAARRFSGDPRIEIHGPGYSKVVLGPGGVEGWRDHLDVIVSSIADNGGRSCVNASGVWVTDRADEVADGLARRLVEIVPRAADDERALLAPFADPALPQRLSDIIDAELTERGAVDVTARYRSGPRVVTTSEGTYLLPTLVLCSRPDHPLANREFLFPFASVVSVAEEALPEALGHSLVVSAITTSERLRQRLLTSSHVERLNFGPIPTNKIGWDQPHEGNLFDHLYGRRAIQELALA